MKKALKIFGITLGTLLSIILLFVSWIEFTDIPKYDVHPVSLKIPTDSASIQHGKKIALVYCASCHLGPDGKFSGRQITASTNPLAELWSANITRHPTLGLGKYSNDELTYLLRTGVKRDGKMAGYFMSSLQMSDNDMASIIAFLRSDDKLLESTEASHPGPDYKLIGKTLFKLHVFKPLPYNGKPVLEPQATDKIAYGRYLTTGRYECYRCHSKSFETNDLVNPEKSEGYLSGGNPIENEEFKPVVSANITSHKINGIGAWTYEQFAQTIKSGMRPNGKTLSSVMPRFASMSDEETQAIWTYLQSVPASANKPQLSGM